jgi:hypothetical protein
VNSRVLRSAVHAGCLFAIFIFSGCSKLLTDRGVSNDNANRAHIHSIQTYVFMELIDRGRDGFSESTFASFLTNKVSKLNDDSLMYEYGLRFMSVSLRTDDWLTALTNNMNGSSAAQPAPKASLSTPLATVRYRDDEGEMRYLSLLNNGLIVRSDRSTELNEPSWRASQRPSPTRVDRGHRTIVD